MNVSLSSEKLSAKERWIAVFVSSIGNLLEGQNFAIFGLLSDEIGKLFFPGNNESIKVLNGFAVFAVAFFMRPFGAALFGQIGDKYGRILSLRISLFIMAIATVGIGCLPNYSSIGIAAPILLTIFRLIQGLSMGGEYAGAITYTLEISSPKQRVLHNVMPSVSSDFGLLSGTIFVGVLRILCTEKQLHTFGWRIPFIFGVVSAILGLWMRTRLQPSGEFIMEKNAGTTLRNPVAEVFKHHKWPMFIVIAHLTLRGVTFYVYWIWFPQYIFNRATHPVQSMYLINGVNLFIKLCVMMTSAHLVDRYLNSNPILTLIIFGTLESIYTVIVFTFCDEMDAMMILFMQMVFAIIDGVYTSGSDLWAVLRFGDNTVIRYSGIGIGYGAGFALFGGTAPLIASALVLKYDIWVLGLWMCCCGIISVSTNIICYFCIDIKSERAEIVGALSEMEHLEQQ